MVLCDCALFSLQALVLDASSAEAVACLAAEHFYSDQPELAIRYYRRLLQVWLFVSAEGVHLLMHGH
jgi:hypothetical protein